MAMGTKTEWEVMDMAMDTVMVNGGNLSVFLNRFR